MIFSGKSKYHKGTLHYPKEIGRSLCKGGLSLSSEFKAITPQYARWRNINLIEHPILPVFHYFQPDSSFSQLQMYSPEHLKFTWKSTPHNTFFTDQLLVTVFLAIHFQSQYKNIAIIFQPNSSFIKTVCFYVSLKLVMLQVHNLKNQPF